MSQSAKLRLIIDTDPGIDDALSLLVALTAPDCEVVGITVVGGNCAVGQAVSNALAITELLGMTSIPVYRGADGPLAVERSWYSDIHGPTGLGGLTVPRRNTPADRPTASQAIVDAVRAAPGSITILTLGPLTNLAVACQLEPRLGALVSRVVIMAGAINTPGNASSVAEANIWNDPHAADIVLSTSLPITLIPLDVTHRAVLTRQRFTRHTQALRGNPVIEFAETITRDYFRPRWQTPGETSAILHDPLALWAALCPPIVKTKNIPVRVSVADDAAIGDTSVATSGPGIEVALDVDVERFIGDFLRRIAHAALMAPGSIP